MTYLLDGWQYIALMGGQGVIAPSPSATPQQTETAADAHGPNPAAPGSTTPKLYVYSIDGK